MVIVDAIKNNFHKKVMARRQESYEKKHDILYKRHKGEKVLFIIMFVLFTAFAISFLFPFLWILINSFKTKSEFASDFLGWPNTWVFENFIDAFTFETPATNHFTILQMLGMSVIIAGLGTIVTVFTSSCAAYVVAKYRFPGRNLIYAVVIFSLIVPIVGALPSQIQLMNNLHLSNTIIGCIFLYSGGFGSNFLLLYSSFKGLSWTYVEAAKIDGASDFRIFFKIIIPLAKGPIIAVTIIQLIGLWNDYLTPSIYLPDMPTIAVGLKTLSDSMILKSNYTMLFATIIIALIPIITLFCAFSKTIMENTSVGGLKG
jgi:ABC-type glycerol-3-phosphate transport system permease component